MSTGIKRKHAAALADAESFRDLFAGCFEEWVFGGSVRRQCREVSDLDHILRPKWEDVPDGLFGEPKKVNLIVKRSEELLISGAFTKHQYNASGFRWGMLHRGMDFKNFKHEIWMAEPANWGGTLSIKTGSQEFSKRLVTGLLRNRRRNKDGHVWECVPCSRDGKCEKTCPECQGTKLKTVKIIPVPTEEFYFDLCGIEFVPPAARSI